jgi:PEP-CTERM motif-containing protein
MNVRPNRIAALLAVLALSPGAVVAQTGSITSNFNGTAIHAGSDIWFNSVFKMTGAVNGTQLRFTGSHITFVANAVHYDIAVPDAFITFSSAYSSGTTAFSGGRWDTHVPLGFGDNIWLSGLAWPVPVNLPGGISNVTWSGTFLGSTPGLSLKWQWAAAVYSQTHSGCGTGNLAGDPNTLGVKPLHSTTLDAYHNGNQAGTTENFRDTDCWIGGARGGGSSNFTGSLSNTGTVRPGTETVPEPGTLVLLATGLVLLGGVVTRRTVA